MTSVGEIAALLDTFAPRQLAESWDNVGLLAGDPAVDVSSLLVTLDVTPAHLDEAALRAAELIVAFHPPIFKPLGRLVADDPAGAVVYRAVREGRHLYATHTGLDCAPRGTSDFLAAALGLEVTGVLKPRAGDLVKLAVFVPVADEATVRQAMADAGAGAIGDYRECSFRTPGTGTFRPLDGANPTIGAVGELTEVAEARVEVLVPRASLSRVLAAMERAHPYEEVAYDLYPLLNESAMGMGRLARCEPMPLGEFAARVGEVCRARHLRWVGEPSRTVETVALVGGSGASFLADAARAGADVYVTGDIKHHDALLARKLDVGLVDPGHYATERFVIPETAAWLRQRLPGLKVYETELDGEPFGHGERGG